MLTEQALERVGEQRHSLSAVTRTFLGRSLLDECARAVLGNKVRHVDRVVVDAEHERSVLLEERGDVGAGPGQALAAGQVTVMLEVDSPTVKALHRCLAGQLNASPGLDLPPVGQESQARGEVRAKVVAGENQEQLNSIMEGQDAGNPHRAGQLRLLIALLVKHLDEGKTLHDQRIDGIRRRHDVHLCPLQTPPASDF